MALMSPASSHNKEVQKPNATSNVLQTAWPVTVTACCCADICSCQPITVAELKNQSTKYILLLHSVGSAGTAADKRTEADAALGQPA